MSEEARTLRGDLALAHNAVRLLVLRTRGLGRVLMSSRSRWLGCGQAMAGLAKRLIASTVVQTMEGVRMLDLHPCGEQCDIPAMRHRVRGAAKSDDRGVILTIARRIPYRRIVTYEELANALRPKPMPRTKLTR